MSLGAHRSLVLPQMQPGADAILMDWAVLESGHGNYIIFGNIYRDKKNRFRDGIEVSTSRVAKIQQLSVGRSDNVPYDRMLTMEPGDIVTTKSGTAYQLGDKLTLPSERVAVKPDMNPADPPWQKHGAVPNEVRVMETPDEAVEMEIEAWNEMLGDGAGPQEFGNTFEAGPEKAIRDAFGKIFFHPKTGHLYTVRSYGFDAQRERWMITYGRHRLQQQFVPSTDFFHLPEDFFRPGRFIEVKE